MSDIGRFCGKLGAKMADSFIQPPKGLDLTGSGSSNISEHWKKFKQRFELYLEATDKVKNSDKQKTSLLLTLVGEQALEVYNTFQFDAVEEGQLENKCVLDKVLKKFDDYCNPLKSVIFERFHFNKASQAENEPVDNFVLRLKQLSRDCEFGELRDQLIRDRIVVGINDSSCARKATAYVRFRSKQVCSNVQS